MGKILEGLWDCPYCGEKGIGGLTKQCPNCGHPQDVDTTFYLGDKKEYLDEEQAQNYGKGADWSCSYCGSLNRYDEEICKGCGATREDADGSYFDNQVKQGKDVADLERESGQKIELADKTKKKLEAKEAEERAKRQAEIEEAKRKRKPFMFGLLALIVIGLAYLLIPRHSGAEVISKSWARTIAIEESKIVNENDWEVPDGGTVTDEREEIHHYEQVVDHYETVAVSRTRQVLDGYDTENRNNGDGTFTEIQVPRYRNETYTVNEQQPVYRDEPVYATMYYYDILRWFDARNVDTSGGSDDPVWGEVTLADNEREYGRTEEYVVTVVSEKKDKEYTVKLTEADWSNLKEGDTVELTIQAGHVKKINDSIVPIG